MSNKIKAKAYHTAVSKYDESTIKKMVHKNYIQHNIKVPTGRDAFIALIPKLKSFGSKIENIRMLEDGQYIIMHHKWINASPFGFNETAAFHIIRFNNDDLIAEHWNVMTELTPKNASGRTLIDGETQITNRDKTVNNKIKIAELFNCYINDSEEDIVASLPQFFQVDFHQHSKKLSDGIKNLIHTIKNGVHFPSYRKQHTILGEGNFILSISEGILNKKNKALYDLFRLENGKIAEHWSVYQDIPTENIANNNTMFNFKNNLASVETH